MKLMLKLCILMFLLGFFGCPAGGVKQDQKKETKLTLKMIVDQFKKDSLFMERIEIYTAKTDPNEILGRPNQYVEKANFFASEKTVKEVDKSKEILKDIQSEKDARETESMGKNSTIEVFANEQDAKARQDYIQEFSKTIKIAAARQYLYLHKNALVRIDFKVLPDDAKKYQASFEKL